MSLATNESDNYYVAKFKQTLNKNFGSTICAEIENKATSEVMLNPDGSIHVERIGESAMVCIGELPRHSAMTLLNAIATFAHTNIDRHNPILECEIAVLGCRFEGFIPPIVASPAFTIRKKAVMIFSVKDYQEKGILPETLDFTKNGDIADSLSDEDNNLLEMSTNTFDFLVQAIRKRENILIVGGTNSGKTTLLNAICHLLAEYAPDDRLLIIEDTPEIQSSGKNVVQLRTSDNVDIRRLVKAAMRSRPDRIIIGEARDGGAALDLLKAWNTGHPGGVATIHANSALEGLYRLEELIEEVSVTPKHRLIGSSINLIIFIEKYRGVRRISQIAKVDGYDVQQKKYRLRYGLNRNDIF